MTYATDWDVHRDLPRLLASGADPAAVYAAYRSVQEPG